MSSRGGRGRGGRGRGGSSSGRGRGKAASGGAEHRAKHRELNSVSSQLAGVIEGLKSQLQQLDAELAVIERQVERSCQFLPPIEADGPCAAVLTFAIEGAETAASHPSPLAEYEERAERKAAAMRLEPRLTSNAGLVAWARKQPRWLQSLVQATCCVPLLDATAD